MTKEQEDKFLFAFNRIKDKPITSKAYINELVQAQEITNRRKWFLADAKIEMQQSIAEISDSYFGGD